jgi:ribosomal protein S27AE
MDDGLYTNVTRWKGVKRVKIKKALKNLNYMHCPDCGGFMNKNYGDHGELFRFYCSKCNLGVPVPKR